MTTTPKGLSQEAILHIRTTLARYYRGEIDDAQAAQALGQLHKDALAEFIFQLFARGLLTRGALDIDDDGQVI
ncbi:hypothetical protein NVV93_10905 [Pseudomonas sp. LS44]|uniref:hypothetical protein n=1 Tax=Pseudomonas sp. LS44 TaxID=1357074 RepID=UPI00215B1F3F|nr:hypothetical protein [Pseudomonas sp. LS44]UVE16147.1 hypothetical protein NVV93_10905 [Pseudomonas sp. LS44]